MNLNIPGYEVLEQIGHGGMAEVYRARHLRLERDVALKVMLEQFSRDATFCDRFVREARIAARLNHPNIVQIFDVDQHEKQLFLAMEYVDGGDLLEKRRQPLSYEQILNILEQLTLALDYAHAQGYIHRDIKPANILFRRDGSLVISDFGIARAIHSDTNMTAAGSMVGTPNYMSPEQAKGQDLDGRADLYSVAVIAYQMLTGELPYIGDSTISIAIKHISEPIPPLSGDLAPLQSFFDRALAKSADDRFVSGAHLVEALRRELVNIPRSITPTADSDKTRLAPSPTHERTTKVDPARQPTPDEHALTKQTLVRPQTDTPDISTETVQKTEVLQGDYISHAPASIRNVLRRINDITGIVVHPQWRKFIIVLSVLLIVAMGLWFIQTANNGTGTEFLAGIVSASSNENYSLSPEQQMRINQLLENARQDIEAGRLSTPPGNNAYEKYLVVLAMAPGHRTALSGINSIAENLLDAATNAVDNGEWNAADEYITQAKMVSPEHPRVIEMADALDQTRQNRDQETSQLFLAANQAKSIGDKKQAVVYLTRILALDSGNTTAQIELHGIAETLIESAQTAVKQNQYNDAREQLASVKNINTVLDNPSLTTAIATLTSAIDSKQNQQQKQNQLNQYLKRAEAAFSQGNYAGGSNSALAYYQQTLNIDSTNPQARQGLDQVKQALAERAQKSLNKLNVDDAKADMQQLQAIDSRAVQLTKLKQALAQAEKQRVIDRRQAQQINELYERAERYLTAQRADGADKIYQRIERVSPNHPGLPDLGKKIADGYVFQAQHEIDGEDWDDVNVWVERGLKHVPNHKKLIEMRAYAEEQKKTRKRGLF